MLIACSFKTKIYFKPNKVAETIILILLGIIHLVRMENVRKTDVDMQIDVRSRGWKMLVFRKNLSTYLNA